jgi:hypothetical protein
MNYRDFYKRLVLAIALVSAGTQLGSSQGGLEVVTGKAFDSAMPKDFYLEGNAIPTEKRNAVLVKNSKGSRVLFALIDTTGYSSQVRSKYIGMIISEVNISICGNSLAVGSYGFGLDKSASPSAPKAVFHVYNQAGEKVAECDAERDGEIKQPRPLQLVLGKDGQAARLYLGRFWVGWQ